MVTLRVVCWAWLFLLCQSTSLLLMCSALSTVLYVDDICGHSSFSNSLMSPSTRYKLITIMSQDWHYLSSRLCFKKCNEDTTVSPYYILMERLQTATTANYYLITDSLGFLTYLIWKHVVIKLFDMLRVLSGSHWGVNQTCILRFYYALFRSWIDKGCDSHPLAHQQLRSLIWFITLPFDL